MLEINKMQGVLKFDLPADEDAFRVAQDGWKYRALVYELDQWLRNIVKHGTDLLPGESAVPYERVRNKLWELLQEDNLETP